MRLSTEQLARMSRLLDEVIDADEAGRRAWLAALPPQHRDIEPALRQALLAPQGGDAFASPPRILALDDAPQSSGLQAGDRVGPYRLVRPLGAGGMAEVWLAQRADGAFSRQVALKMPSGLERREDLARRFAIERDILAALEHPHIARFYDAGVSEDGRPYLALEYVAGRSLLQWADEHRLGIRERVALFLQVLEAVQYAHDKGVLHRDIKPANVLVTEAGKVNLLDFGVARLMERPADADVTRLYGRALTPAYASPEQLRGAAIDATSDVYSLGVVLCELLSGRPPTEAAGATAPPSTRLDANAAEVRGGSAARIGRVLEGELDAIVLKALSAEPQQRYGSASALARDLRRHLAGEAVQAMPPSMPYRARKFVARHRAGAAVAAAGLVLLGVTGREVVRRHESAQAASARVASASANGAMHPPVRSPSVEALDLVMQADVYASGPFQRDAERAEVTYRKAIAVDPANALPWARLALLHMNEGARSPGTRTELLARAREAIDNALRVDPASMAAQAARFRYAVQVDHRWAEARAALDRMRTIDPGDAVALPQAEAYYASVNGRLDEAVRIQRQVVHRDPMNAAAMGAMASYLLQSDRFAESIVLYRRELELNPHAVGNHGLIGVNLALLGKGEQAMDEIDRERDEGYRLWASSIAAWAVGRRDESGAALAELRKHPQGRAWRIAQLYALRGKTNAAFEWLNKACTERQGGCELLKSDRFLRNLRGEPRFRALLAKMKLDGDPPPSTQ